MKIWAYGIALAFTATCALAASGERENVSKALEDRVGHGLASQPTADAGPDRTPPNVRLDDGLTEQEAVALALWNNAALRATLSDLGLAQADLREAGLLLNPNFQMLIGNGGKPFEFLLTAPIEALWQRPKRVAAAKLNLESVAELLVQNGLDLVRDTRLAFADYRAAVQQARRAAEVAEAVEEIAELDAKRQAAGDIGESDLHLSRLDALTARDAAAQLQLEPPAAWQRLSLLAGLPAAAPPIAPGDSSAAPREPMQLEALLEAASRYRPDLRAAELAVEAVGKRLGWQKSTTFAMVAPLLSSKGIGTTGIKTGPGLMAEIPLFNRGQGRVSRAEAELEQAALRLAALREQVAAETAAAAARLAQAREALDRLQQQLIPAAQKAVAFSEKAYESGDIAYLDVRRANRPFLDLKLREVAAEAAVARAGAELDRAAGRNL